MAADIHAPDLPAIMVERFRCWCGELCDLGTDLSMWVEIGNFVELSHGPHRSKLRLVMVGDGGA